MLCSLKIYSFGGFDEIRKECCWFQDSRSDICLISTLTSKMPVRCTEHQDLVGEKDERGKALLANVERGVGIFLQNCHSFLPIRRI